MKRSIISSAAFITTAFLAGLKLDGIITWSWAVILLPMLAFTSYMMTDFIVDIVPPLIKRIIYERRKGARL